MQGSVIKLSKLTQLKKLYIQRSLGFKYSDDFMSAPSLSQGQMSNSNKQNTKTISALNQTISSCLLCESAKNRTSVLRGYGSNNADIFFILPQPNALNDANSSILEGRSIHLLSKIVLNVLKMKMSDIYITFAIKCKIKSQNKTPKVEISNCKDYITSEINIIKPKLIVTLGENSFRYMTNNDEKYNTMRLRVLSLMNVSLITTTSLGEILKNPSLKKQIYDDFLLIKSHIEKIKPSPN